MPGNPKGSKWRSTPRVARKRKGIEVMLSDEARARLDLLASAGARSSFIERLILDHPLPKEKKT